MTEQELRDIDVRVHREVMGLECEFASCGPGDDWGYWFDTGETHSDETAKWAFDAIPAYTRSIDAAWQVVDKMRERFSNVSIHIDNGAAMQMFHIDRTGEVIRSAYGENAETAPLAICLASLKAMGAMT